MTVEDDRNGRICAKMKATTGTLLSAAAGTQLGRKMGLGLDGDAAPRSNRCSQGQRSVESRVVGWI